MTALLNRQFYTALALRQGVEHAAVQIESETGSVGDNRRFVREQLAIWMFPAAGKLVTNAVLHTCTRPPGESKLTGVTRTFKPGIALEVLVSDQSDQLPMASIRPSVNVANGRGLVRINALADGWTAAPGGELAVGSVGALPMHSRRVPAAPLGSKG